MEAIVHVGLPKTGTTSIQLALGGYDDGEAFYADLGVTNHSDPISSVVEHPNWSLIWQNQFGLDESGLAAKHSELKSLFFKALKRSDRKRVIFSGEGISTLGRDSLETLRAYLDEHCDKVKIVVFLRDPFAAAISTFQEKVKHGQTPKGATQDLDMVKRAHTKLTDIFGQDRVTVLFYEDKKDFGGDIVAMFFDATGLGLSRVKPKRGEANQSISAEAVKLVGLLNQSNAVTKQGPIHYSARWRFVFTIDRVLRTTSKMPKGLLNGHLNLEDLDFLQTELGRTYTAPEPHHQTVAEWMADISQDMLDDIASFLDANGFPCPKKDDARVVVNTLYYFCITQEYNKQRRKSWLRRLSEPFLRR